MIAAIEELVRDEDSVRLTCPEGSEQRLIADSRIEALEEALDEMRRM